MHGIAYMKLIKLITYYSGNSKYSASELSNFVIKTQGTQTPTECLSGK